MTSEDKGSYVLWLFGTAEGVPFRKKKQATARTSKKNKQRQKQPQVSPLRCAKALRFGRDDKVYIGLEKEQTTTKATAGLSTALSTPANKSVRRGPRYAPVEMTVFIGGTLECAG